MSPLSLCILALAVKDLTWINTGAQYREICEDIGDNRNIVVSVTVRLNASRLSFKKRSWTLVFFWAVAVLAPFCNGGCSTARNL